MWSRNNFYLKKEKPYIISGSQAHRKYFETKISSPNIVPDINEDTLLPSTSPDKWTGHDIRITTREAQSVENPSRVNCSLLIFLTYW